MDFVGLILTKSKYALYLDVDVELNDSTIEVLYSKANKLNNFSILGPSIKNFSYKNEFYLKKNILPKVHSMNFITGCALFFNMKALNKIGLFYSK